MQLIYYGDTLMHYGILGQKWGRRRYQNPDGSLTPAGRARYGRGEGYYNKDGKLTDKGKSRLKEIDKKYYTPKNEKQKKDHSAYFERTIKQGKDKPTISPAEKIAKDANSATQTGISAARNLMDAFQSKKPKTNRAAKLSDDELRTRINRLRMEGEYNRLTDDDTSKGYEYANTVLSLVGSVATIAATTVGTIATVKALKQNGG